MLTRGGGTWNFFLFYNPLYTLHPDIPRNFSKMLQPIEIIRDHFVISFRKVERVITLTCYYYVRWMLYIVRKETRQKGRGGERKKKKEKKKKGRMENSPEIEFLYYRDVLFGNISYTRHRESISRLQITDE